MTYLQAIHFIRRHSRKGDGLVETFKVVCETRRSTPVRQWAIYDLANACWVFTTLELVVVLPILIIILPLL